MIYGSVCSGIEAASVAWHGLGWTPAWFSEIEKFPSAALDYRWPGVPNLGNMRKLDERKEYREQKIDLLVGGTPCQSFSIAGLRKGMDDDRGNLTLEFCRILATLRPRWFVWENVPGVLSSKRGRDFGTFLGALAQLGYGWSYRVLDAQWFGVAQRRRRVFVVGYLGDWRAAAAVLFERESLLGNPPPSREARQETAGIVTGGVKGSGQAQFHIKGTYRWQNNTSGIISDEVSATLRRESATTDERSVPAYVAHQWPADISPTLNAHFGEKQGLENQHIYIAEPDYLSPARCLTGSNQRIDAETETLIPCQGGFFDVAHTLKADGFDASEDGTGRQNLVVQNEFKLRGVTIHGTDGTINVASFTDVAGALRARPPGGQENSSTTAVYSPINFSNELTASTEISGPMQYGGQGGRHDGVMLPNMAVRRLTPRECERLQGFPDDYSLIPIGKKMSADGPRYKALGNSMAVPVMWWIGSRIELFERTGAVRKFI